jgi:hypothetical protein
VGAAAEDPRSTGVLDADLIEKLKDLLMASITTNEGIQVISRPDLSSSKNIE